MNQKLTVVFLFSFLLCLIVNAQVTGTITDKNTKETIPFANVIAINTKDSSIVKAALSNDNGFFEITDIDEALTYRLKIVMLGFANYYTSEFNFKKNTPHTINCAISVSAKDLASFELVEKVPFLEQQAGKMIVNVSENITGVSGSMMDLMKKVPGVLVINKKLSLSGNQNVTILINGKPTQYLDMQTLMTELPAEDIEKIEVISQPDATMDATGTSGVINIILKKNKLSGTNGSINTGFGYGKLGKYRIGGTINYRKDKINVFGNGGYSHNTSVESMILERRIGSETFFQNTYQPSFPKNYRINGGIDYDLTDKQMIGIALKHSQSSNNRTNENVTYIKSLATDTVYTLQTDNNMKRQWYYNSIDLYYNIELDTNGQKLTVSTNYGTFDNSAVTNIITTASHNIKYPSQKNEEPGKTAIYAAKTDYILPLGKKLKLTSGLKYSYANVDGDLRASLETNAGFVNNTALSNHFIFTENIYAAYLMQEFNSKKISFQTGLRYEHSLSKGYSVTIDTSNNRTISKLFPSAGISLPLSKKLGSSLAYSYRIQRPSYNTLNPFISYLDPYTYEKGNTSLRPELTHSGKFSLTFENQPFFNLEYNRTNDVLMLVTEQDDNTGVSYAKTANLKQYDKYGGSFFFPLDFIKPLEGYGGIMAYYHKFNAPYLDAIYNNEQFSYTLFIEASAKILKTLTIEGSGWYNSKGIEGIMVYNPLYGVSFGLQKTFFDDQFTINVSYDDAFFEYWSANINYSNMNVDITSKWETRVINFNLLYKFGNRFLKKRNQQRTSAEEELNRANQKK